MAEICRSFVKSTARLVGIEMCVILLADFEIGFLSLFQ